MKPISLALLAASPVHYQVPIYRRLEADTRVDFTAIFCSRAGVEPADLGFQGSIAWGGDLLGGYRSEFLRRAESKDVRGGFLSLRDTDVVGRLRSGRYDVLWLHGYNYLTHQLAAATQRSLGGGVMFREEQTPIHDRGMLKTLVKGPALRTLFRGATGLYIGTESRRWFEHYGMPEERLFFTPYCTDNERLQRAAAELGPERDNLRRSFGIDPDAGPVLLTVSRLAPEKQPARVLEAFQRVRSERRCALLIVGTGPEGDALRRAVAEQSIPDVAFAGFLDQTEIARAYASADAFVLFSAFNETWGIVVNEAMNFGLPIVVSDKVGCGRDLVDDGHNGWVVPFDDTEALAGRIAELVESAELRERLGRASLEIVDAWNPDVTAAGVIDATQASANRRGRRAQRS